MSRQPNINSAEGLRAFARDLAGLRGVTGKTDIAAVSAGLGLDQHAVGHPGDDCAALPDGHGGWTLYAIEGFIPGFVQADPWFAGWCGVMVNISDVLAMGGTPTAVVNAIWAPDAASAEPALQGMAAAAKAYGVPIVGGHSNLGADQLNLSVSVLGHTHHLLTSFDARPGDVLICAIDHRGAYRPPFDNWQAALEAPHKRLRDDAALLPDLAATGWISACKDISQAGILGTALMLGECSGVGMRVDLQSILRPPDVPLDRWLRSFPSFGFLLTAKAVDAPRIIDAFAGRDIAAAAIGVVTEGSALTLAAHTHTATFWDHADTPYMGLAPKELAHA
ncbi:sll0787 family AIR synthase-like protein [Gymnodinialimonas sp. 2305UL16-5]|uniref:sll0787 family AIR synthase-like protein n=1 Tax=Gymnodinialimonas mytili TaxID=3126503 RepID=UPI0030A9A9E4